MKVSKPKRNLPNTLTLIRLILVLPLLLFISLALAFKNERGFEIFLNIVIFLIFIFAMITDYFDGYYARKYNLVSNFGKLWDPIADKIITTTLLVYLSIIHLVPFWILMLFLLRDLIIAGVRTVMAEHKIGVQADKLGKLKTLLLSIGLAILIFYNIIAVAANHDSGFFAQSSSNWEYIGQYVVGLPILLAAILSTISGVQYFNKVRKYVSFKNDNTA